jgi:hypothetical protein
MNIGLHNLPYPAMLNDRFGSNCEISAGPTNVRSRVLFGHTTFRTGVLMLAPRFQPLFLIIIYNQQLNPLSTRGHPPLAHPAPARPGNPPGAARQRTGLLCAGSRASDGSGSEIAVQRSKSNGHEWRVRAVCRRSDSEPEAPAMREALYNRNSRYRTPVPATRPSSAHA